jgi:hypothetical protein
VNLF